MAVRFILGRAGSGKTWICLEEIRRILRQSPWGPPLLFLVPEQATFQMEYALVTTPDLPGSVRARVVSFRRLAREVLASAGGSQSPPLGELGRQMVLRLLLRRHLDELRIFRPSAGRAGFAGQLAGLIKELHTYNVEASALEECLDKIAAGGAGRSLAAKLRDVLLLLQAYESFLAGRFSDPDALLNLAARRLLEARLLAGAVVWVDGFAGFTPQEYRMLAAIFAQAAKVSVALCVDFEPAEASLFQPTLDTYRRLKDLADRLGLEQEELRLPSGNQSGPQGAASRFANNPVLAHLEREFGKPIPRAYPGVPRGLSLVVAANPWAEVEGAARAMLELVKKGCRWRDMAVIVRNLEDYRDTIALVFRTYGIPFFLDARRPVLHHPLARLLLAAVEVVASGWAAEPVFQCLKTDLWPLGRGEIDGLENYVLAYGVAGAAWREEEPWKYHQRAAVDTRGFSTILGRVDYLRRQVVKLFGPLGRVTPGTRLTVREWTAGLWQLVENLEVAATLERWQEEAVRQGDPSLAEEHGQAWEGIRTMSDELVNALGEELLTAREYGEVLRAGLEGLFLGLIPPGLDQVLVGSVERSRQPDLRAVFVLGVNEGLFPARFAEESLLGDAERETLLANGVELAPSCRQRLFAEDFLAYIAFTRPREFLWVSYCLADEEGRPRQPSPFIARLRRLFPDLVEIRLDAPVTVPAQASPGRQDPTLPPETVRRLYPSPVLCSISRLEAFARCPFAHFAAYGLDLQGRQDARFDPPSLGVFLHETLHRVAESLERRGKDWRRLTVEEGEAVAREVVAELLAEEKQGLFPGSARLRYIMTHILCQIAVRVVNLLAAHARAGRFSPVAVEAAFGPGGPLAPLRLELGNGQEACLVGRIDRVEAARGRDGWYVRVIDYKTGRAAFGQEKALAGVELQLPLYLAVAVANAERLLPERATALPAGLFYFPLADPIIPAKGKLAPEEAEAAGRRRLRLQGLLLAEDEAVHLMAEDKEMAQVLLPVSFNQDGRLAGQSRALSRAEMEQFLNKAKEKARELLARMLRGEVAATPARVGGEPACRDCPYPAVCQRDDIK